MAVVRPRLVTHRPDDGGGDDGGIRGGNFRAAAQRPVSDAAGCNVTSPSMAGFATFSFSLI
jgi:hypothetical protein